jgi:hypothetical protein
MTPWPRVVALLALGGVCVLTGFVLGAVLLVVFALAISISFNAAHWWICPQCGAHSRRRFSWAHSPAWSVQACGCDPVHFWRVRRARQRDRDAARRVWMMRESRRWRG